MLQWLCCPSEHSDYFIARQERNILCEEWSTKATMLSPMNKPSMILVMLYSIIYFSLLFPNNSPIFDFKQKKQLHKASQIKASEKQKINLVWNRDKFHDLNWFHINNMKSDHSIFSLIFCLYSIYSVSIWFCKLSP